MAKAAKTTKRINFNIEGIAGFMSTRQRPESDYTSKYSEQDGKGDYTASILIPKNDPQVGKLLGGLAKLYMENFDLTKSEVKALFAGTNTKLNCPIADGDKGKREDNHGCWVLTARSKKEPINSYVIKGREIVEDNTVSSSDRIALSGNFYTYDMGKGGVGAGASGVLILEKLGHASPEAMFGEQLAQYGTDTEEEEEGVEEELSLDDLDGDSWGDEEEEDEPEEEPAPKKKRRSTRKTTAKKAAPVEEPEEDEDEEEEEEEAPAPKKKRRSTRKTTAKKAAPADDEEDVDWAQL